MVCEACGSGKCSQPRQDQAYVTGGVEGSARVGREERVESGARVRALVPI